MPQPITAATLMNRFITEQEYIQKYLAFLQDKALFNRMQVDQLVMLLVGLDIIPLSSPLYYELRRPNVTDLTRSYDWAALESIHARIMECVPKIETAIHTALLEAQQSKAPLRLDNIDSRSPLGELLQYALNILKPSSPWRDMYSVFQRAPKDEKLILEGFDELDNSLEWSLYLDLKWQLEVAQREQGDEFKILDADSNTMSIDDAANLAIAGARQLLRHESLEQLLVARQDVNQFDLAVKMSKPDAELNSFRQAFINLMALFDATLFDIVRVAFRNDFFKVLPGFVTEDKLSMSELSKYGSFERVRDAVTEQRLKGLYVKDLLLILQGKLGIDLVVAGDSFVQLIELVLRRNIHLHNRGIVDDRYLELNPAGKPKYNLYNLMEGSVAAIDESYWEAANRLCKNAITAAAQWADSL
jgi:hypothetical protein